MLQKLQEYKWYLIIGISVLIMLTLIYQSYNTNKKVNMLYKCLNELSYRIDEVAETVVSKSQTSQTRPTIQQQPKKQLLRQTSIKKPSKTLPPASPNVKVNPQPDTQVYTKQQPMVSETIILQVSPSQVPPSRMTASTTIEEIDSDDSDVEVEEIKMKDVDLDKALEAELSELND